MKLIVIFLFVLPTVLLSQKINNASSYRDMGSETYFRFHYDNDFFAATDKNYTQGYSFEFANPLFKKNPVNHIFIKLKGQSNTYGLAIEHIGFTPSNFVSIDIQTGDRPFAAAIYLKSFATSTDTLKKSRLSQSFSLGFIGPGAFGKEMQTEIHRLTGNKIPGGWDNQIQNDLVLNVKFDYEKQLFRYNELLSLQSVAAFQLGTLFSNAMVGFNTTFGLIDLPFSGSGYSSAFKLFAYAQPVVSIIGYDATLQGGIFTNDNPYEISSKDIERVTSQIDYGLILKYKRLYLEYTRTSITREFKSGNAAKWGGFRVGYVFL
tara:strand:- start:1027 stop:1983 length:957 start_codon:yes stop_codon:yes gene_type:complete